MCNVKGFSLSDEPTKNLLFEQCVGDRGSAGRRPVGAADLPADARAEAGPVHAGPAEAAGGADEDHGQRGHLLHAAHALHLHLQVAICISDIKNVLILKGKKWVNLPVLLANGGTTSKEAEIEN